LFSCFIEGIPANRSNIPEIRKNRNGERSHGAVIFVILDIFSSVGEEI
jgi:hypothetical protein